MVTEAPRPQGEQPSIDPIQVARSAFNQELFGREYHTGTLLTRTIQLQNALLGSDLSPEKIYHELSIVAGQGKERAELYEDADTATTLRELQTGFQLTYETFRPSLEAATKATRPTRTETLPPMTSAKGGEVKPQTPAQPQAKEQEVSGTAEEAEKPQEQKETAKTQIPQEQPKRPGRKPKSAQQ